MKLINRKAIFTFGVSLIIFSLAALLIAALLSIGRGGLFGSDNTKYGVGEHFSILLVMTDYSPEKFNDYDAQSVENVFKTVSSDTGTRKIRTESMVLVRFDPARSEITLTPLSGNTVVSVKGKETVLESVASDHGIDVLTEKIRAMTGLEIDRCAVFTPASAGGAFDKIGSFKYRVSDDLVLKDGNRGIDISIESGRQSFDGKKAVDLIRYYSCSATYENKEEILLDFSKKIIEILSDDFTYDEICGIMSFISETACVNGAITEDQMSLMYNYMDFDVELLAVKGSLDGNMRFVPDENATLEEFKPYRRIYS